MKVCAMGRGCVFAGLALAILTLCGCSNSVQRLDLSEWHKYMPQEPFTGDEISRSLKMSKSMPRAPVARDLINRAEREAAVASRSEFRPWARVDAKDSEPLEDDDDSQDRKPEQVSRKTCRGC
jgi:hypothetical protein